MRPQHYMMVAIFLLIGYGIGVKFPSFGQKIGL